MSEKKILHNANTRPCRDTGFLLESLALFNWLEGMEIFTLYTYLILTLSRVLLSVGIKIAPFQLFIPKTFREVSTQETQEHEAKMTPKPRLSAQWKR